MKKKLPRIVACLMACIIAFNGIAIPKAKAAVLPTAALTAACLSVYLMGTGFSFGSNNWDVDSGNEIIANTLISKYDEFSAYIKSSPEELRSRLASGTEILTNGVVKFNSSVCALLAEFSDWLIDTFQLVPGADLTPVYSATTDGFYSSNGDFYEFSKIVYTGGEPYVIAGHRFMADDFNANHRLVLERNSVYTKYVYGNYVHGRVDGFAWIDSASTNVLHSVNFNYGSYIIRDAIGQQWIITDLSEDSAGYKRMEDNPTCLSFANYPWIDEFFGIEVADVSVGLTAGYESAPDVDEQYVMALDTGLTYAGEQGFIDSVLSGTASGTLAPTYEIEEETSSDDDIVIPDSGADVDSGILNWVKDIAQSVKALPQSIADAVKGLFVPDEALMHEITSVFSNKFGFVPDLHALVVDLRELDADSEPPVIYIHLEDAEGSIDYGGTVKVLDMSWFARYKEDVDRITGGFLWLGFLWLCFMRVSDIINGAGLVYGLGTPPEHIDFSVDDTPRLPGHTGRKRKR